MWALEKTDYNQPNGTAPGVLFAFDAVHLAQLYASTTCAADQIAPATKFSVPTVANGYVYLGTQDVTLVPPVQNTGKGRFYIFGPGRVCQ